MLLLPFYYALLLPFAYGVFKIGHQSGTQYKYCAFVITFMFDAFIIPTSSIHERLLLHFFAYNASILQCLWQYPESAS